ncbi:hypothetical protein S40285_02660 [Stachybotrys chlorohalonatus IBT 40285]|uniref:Heterokaryon incompatibility domain-containing protein n=1 Tax=Stachybotrys chlorohalonatus (strain IBT 40285) TaxID=1283841 RepID=A0A084QXK7_STAC4|nr:hypothetical protein S40285_02660 [Stachybotrys chlorohalonata IBT 40285]
MSTSPSAPQTTALTPFEYGRLKHDGAIRILTLYPGRADEPLVGRLTVEDVNAGVDYEAISYVWGSLDRCAQMVCDGKVLPLTQSIHDALRRMRHPSEPRRLWADQLCINQDDLAERSHQVSLMNTLYKNARRILVWLGNDEQGLAHGAMHMVHHLHDVFEDDKLHEVFRIAHSDGLAKQNQELWVPLSSLTKLPWFHRIWIVQEIGTAAPASLFWGDVQIEWEKLSAVARVLNQSYHHLRSAFAVYTPNIRYLHQRFVEPEGAYDEHCNRGSFIYELHRARPLASKDPRDRVYAFLGHFSLRTGSRFLAGLEADYSRTVEDVYLDVAVRELKGATSLILLSACHPGQIPNPKEPQVDEPRLPLPSWVPDWRVMPLHIIGSPETPHRAAGSTTPRLTIDKHRKELHIVGVRVDAIARVSLPFHGFSFQFRPASKRRVTLEAVWQRVCGQRAFSLDNKYVTGEPALYALLQTLTNACIGGDRSDGYRAVSAAQWLANGAAFLVRTRRRSDDLCDEIRELAQRGDPYRWSHEATLVARHRSFAVTAAGYFVIGPAAVEAGDVVVVLYGGRTPFVLRRTEDGEAWVLVGECYVHGLMNGEGLSSEAEDEVFVIR